MKILNAFVAAAVVLAGSTAARADFFDVLKKVDNVTNKVENISNKVGRIAEKMDGAGRAQAEGKGDAPTKVASGKKGSKRSKKHK